MPALGKRSDIGMNADPMMPKACSMPCICKTFTKASSVVIFILTPHRRFSCEPDKSLFPGIAVSGCAQDSQHPLAGLGPDAMGGGGQAGIMPSPTWPPCRRDGTRLPHPALQ